MPNDDGNFHASRELRQELKRHCQQLAGFLTVYTASYPLPDIFSNINVMADNKQN